MKISYCVELAEKALGYTFRDKSLPERALTHPSRPGSAGHDYQRLEFLGDAVLELCVSEQLFRLHPDMQEGAMTRMRQKLVREEKLAGAASKMGLGNAIFMDRNLELSGGRANESVLCDIFESLLAAVYLDGGLEEARKIVLAQIGGFTDTDDKDPKSALQEYLQGQGAGTPAYITLREEGPAHCRVFTVSVAIGGKTLSEGSGTSKQRAEQDAARKALEQLQHSGE